MSVLKVGEKGKIIQMGSGAFDLSLNTDLQIQFTKPDKTQLIVNKVGGVSAPAVQTTVDVVIDGVSTPTTFEANEYFEYAFVDGDLDQSGLWVANGIYIEGTAKEFCGDPFVFNVLPC